MGLTRHGKATLCNCVTDSLWHHGTVSQEIGPFMAYCEHPPSAQPHISAASPLDGEITFASLHGLQRAFSTLHR